MSGTTKVFTRQFGPLWIARVGVAFLGTGNRPAEYLRTANPFWPDFHDNFAEGFGLTEDKAIVDLWRDINEFAGMLWA